MRKMPLACSVIMFWSDAVIYSINGTRHLKDGDTIEMTSVVYFVMVTKLTTSTSTLLALFTAADTSIVLSRGLKRG